jgi:phage virion morphogenesis protein
MFVIKSNDAQVAAHLARAVAKIGAPAPLMAAVANELLSQTEANFAAQGRPAWLGRKYPRKDGNSGKLLQNTGQLAGSVQPFHTGDTAGVGSNKVYAAIHQLGGETRPHEIRPKNKRALAFNGRVVKKVKHPGSKIPARPFLPIDKSGNLQPQAATAILSVTNAYLRSIFGN